MREVVIPVFLLWLPDVTGLNGTYQTKVPEHIACCNTRHGRIVQQDEGALLPGNGNVVNIALIFVTLCQR